MKKTLWAALVKPQLQNNIKDDERGVHRFMSSYETPEAYSVFVFSLTNGSETKADTEKDLGIYLHKS